MNTPSLSRVSTPKMLEYSLQWTATSGATRYELYEQKNSGSWGLVYSGASTSMLFTQPIIANYDYLVRACNNSGCTIQQLPIGPCIRFAPGASSPLI
ncbi:MAG: hypothetical protein MJK04_23660 [Psychrosphaera sp.]|nr:hypothetical protein [Psychrosphaera sp.]